jgi:Protein of unknown function (DUF2897)
MSRALLVILIVLGLLVGLMMTLRSSAKTGMPSKEVLERATRRAREIDAREKRGD